MESGHIAVFAAVSAVTFMQLLLGKNLLFFFFFKLLSTSEINDDLRMLEGFSVCNGLPAPLRILLWCKHVVSM